MKVSRRFLVIVAVLVLALVGEVLLLGNRVDGPGQEERHRRALRTWSTDRIIERLGFVGGTDIPEVDELVTRGNQVRVLQRLRTVAADSSEPKASAYATYILFRLRDRPREHLQSLVSRLPDEFQTNGALNGIFSGMLGPQDVEFVSEVEQLLQCDEPFVVELARRAVANMKATETTSSRSNRESPSE